MKKVSNVNTDKELAKIWGLSQQDFAARKKRGSLLPLILQYALNANVDLNWLLKGDLNIEEIRTGTFDADRYSLIPLLQSWVKGGPEGRLIYEGIQDYFPFKRYYIEKLVGATLERHKELFLVRVRGDSMAPTINDGEIVLFDTNENERMEIHTGQIYLVQLPDGTVSVKRLSLSLDPEGARLICHSDNVAGYRMFDFRLTPGRPIHSYVLGRVRWAGKEFD